MKVPKSIQKYLNKYLRHCLMKEEREALFREHPRPDLDATLARRPTDTYLTSWARSFLRSQTWSL